MAVGTRMPINVAWVSAMVGLAAGSASSIRSTNSTTEAGRVMGGSRSTSPWWTSSERRQTSSPPKVSRVSMSALDAMHITSPFASNRTRDQRVSPSSGSSQARTSAPSMSISIARLCGRLVTSV